MAFGVDDLMWILGGVSYKAIDATKKLASEEKSRTKSEFIQTYILENTDSSLEKRVGEDVSDPQKYEEMWRRIEQFQRDNPVSGWCRRYKGSSIIYTPQFPSSIPHNFSLADVGKKRLYFWSKAKNKRAYQSEMENIFYDYQEIAIALLMWTYGKESKGSARKNAMMIYDRITNKPRFPSVY